MVTRSRSELPAWLRPLGQRLSPAVRLLVIVETVAAFAYFLITPLRPIVEQHLALGPGVLRGELWQPLTSLFVHIDPVSLIFNLVGLWFVGASLEQQVGSRRFWILFLVPAVFGHLAEAAAMVLFRQPVVSAGCGLAIVAFFVAFALLFPGAQARVVGALVMDARRLSALLIGFSLVMTIAYQQWPALAGTVVAIVVSALVVGRRAPGGVSGLVASFRPSKPRRRYQVLEGGKRDRKPPYVN